MKKILFFLLFIFIYVPAVNSEQIQERKISFGGQLTGGNTILQSLHTDFFLNRNRKWVNETTIKGSIDQSFSSGTETQFKIYSSLRYGQSLNKKYYRFYKLELEHDRFQDINFRIIPTLGLGYWFADETNHKTMIEMALGYQREYFLSQTVDEMAVLALNFKFLLGALSNKLYVYSAVNDFNNYRFVNTTKFSIKLNEYYAFKWELKDEYNNQPVAGVEKNDLSFVTSLEYVFKDII